MIILGIDPGTATTGFGIIEKKKTGDPIAIDFGVISTNKSDSDSERLFQVAEDLNLLIKKYKPKVIGVEKLFFETNQKTAMSVSQARGVVLYIAQAHHLPIFEYTPLQVKNRICGYGKAEKSQVQFMVKKTFGLKTIPKPDDAADALAIALCAYYDQKLF